MLERAASVLRAISGLIVIIATVPIPSAFSQQYADDSWTAEIARPDTVAAHYASDDEIEQAALRESALRIIRDYMEEFIGPRMDRKQLTAREQDVLTAYRDAQKAVHGAVREKYDSSDEADSWRRYWNRRSTLRYDEAFALDVLEQFAPPIAQRMKPQLLQRIERERIETAAEILFPILIVAVPICFLYLLISSWLDRRTKYGVSIDDQQDRVEITYKRGKFGPLAALSVYPVYFNILLFLVTLSIALIFLFAAVENSDWMKQLERSPFPDFLKVIFYRQFWVGIGLTILTAPWWLLALANLRRRGKRSVAVTREGFKVGGKTYNKELARGCYVYGTHVSGDEVEPKDPEIVVAGGNLASRAAASGAMHRAAIAESAGRFKRALGRVQHKVLLDHGEQTRVLAKQLPLRRAELVHAALYEAANRLHEDEEVSSTTGD